MAEETARSPEHGRPAVRKTSAARSSSSASPRAGSTTPSSSLTLKMKSRRPRSSRREGLCDSYVLITSAGLTGPNAARIRARLKAVGVKHVRTFGSTWISEQIRENKRLRMLIPRVYGLGDLSQILDERAYLQARIILESMREDLAKVVVTDAYRKAVDAINEHGFVLLVGEPAAGKTTVASLLAMAAFDQWNASMLKLEDPGKVVEQLEPARTLPILLGGRRFRRYAVRRFPRPTLEPRPPTNQDDAPQGREDRHDVARLHLQPRAQGPEGKRVSSVEGEPGRHRRPRPLNRRKAADSLQPPQTREAATFLPHRNQAPLGGCGDHPRFIPETARRLADPLFTKGLIFVRFVIGQFVEKREQLCRRFWKGSTPTARPALRSSTCATAASTARSSSSLRKSRPLNVSAAILAVASPRSTT